MLHLPHSKILDWSKSKGFADENLDIRIIKVFSEDVKYIVEKGKKNAGYQHFLILTHYQTTNFRLFQTERVCRRQFQI